MQLAYSPQDGVTKNQATEAPLAPTQALPELGQGIVTSTAVAQPPLAAASEDFWSTGENFTVADAFHTGEAVSASATLEPKSKRLGKLLALGLIGGLACFGVETYLSSGVNPLGPLWQKIESSFSTSPVAQIPRHAPKAHSAPSTPRVAVKVMPPPSDPANPYWALTNRLEGINAPLGTTWTAQQEDQWRAGLEHRFVYQHYKTVMDVRQARLAGSEAILQDALNDGKFWTRMQAVIGLAEFGEDVGLANVEKALGQARPDLMARFFQRFRLSSSPAERLVMRYALRLVDANARLVILQGLNSAGGELRDLYLAAATFDPAPNVQAWLKVALNDHPVANLEALRQKVKTATLDDGGAEEAADEATPAATQPPQNPLGAAPVNGAPMVPSAHTDKVQPAADPEVDDVKVYDQDAGAGAADTGEPNDQG